MRDLCHFRTHTRNIYSQYKCTNLLITVFFGAKKSSSLSEEFDSESNRRSSWPSFERLLFPFFFPLAMVRSASNSLRFFILFVPLEEEFLGPPCGSRFDTFSCCHWDTEGVNKSIQDLLKEKRYDINERNVWDTKIPNKTVKRISVSRRTAICREFFSSISFKIPKDFETNVYRANSPNVKCFRNIAIGKNKF